MTSDQNWKPCPRGTLHAIADKQAADRRKMITRRSAFAVVGTLAAGLAYGLRPPTTAKIGPLSCLDIMELADRYVLGQLSPDHAAAVEAHLRKCSSCNDKIRKLGEAHV